MSEWEPKILITNHGLVMINLTQNTVNNDIYVYVNTMDPSIPWEDPSFLFGFKNSYNNQWSYVVPSIISQNSRFTVFGITTTSIDQEDPIDGSVALFPSGNWTYKLWATDEPTLDPDFGELLDEGQMQLVACVDETAFISYVGDNDSSKATVYLTRDCSGCLVWSTCPDIFSLVVVKWNECNYLTRDCSGCLVWSTCPDIFSLVVVKWNECN